MPGPLVCNKQVPLFPRGAASKVCNVLFLKTYKSDKPNYLSLKSRLPELQISKKFEEIMDTLDSISMNDKLK